MRSERRYGCRGSQLQIVMYSGCLHILSVFICLGSLPLPDLAAQLPIIVLSPQAWGGPSIHLAYQSDSFIPLAAVIKPKMNM